MVLLETTFGGDPYAQYFWVALGPGYTASLTKKHYWKIGATNTNLKPKELSMDWIKVLREYDQRLRQLGPTIAAAGQYDPEQYEALLDALWTDVREEVARE